MTDEAVVDKLLLRLRIGEDIRPRSMFWGRGLFAGGAMFAIVYGGRIFFKTSPAPPRFYAGAAPFSPAPGKSITSFRKVPLSTLELPDVLASLAHAAISEARTRKASARARG